MCPAGRSRGAKHSPRETGIRVSAPFPGGGGTHPLGLEFKQSSLARAWPNSRTPLDPLTLGLTSLHPHAVVPSLLSDEGKRIVLPAFFQRGRDFPDKTRQTLATAHAPGRQADAPWRFSLAPWRRGWLSPRGTASQLHSYDPRTLNAHSRSPPRHVPGRQGLPGGACFGNPRGSPSCVRSAADRRMPTKGPAEPLLPPIPLGPISP